MINLVYDTTFDGLITAIFEVYNSKLTDFRFLPAPKNQVHLYDRTTKIISTNKAKANRLKLGLMRKTGIDHLPFLYQLFESDKADKEVIIYQFVKRIFEISVKVTA